MAAPVSLISKPGIKRDGTKFDGDAYTDGQWVRFQRGLPRKMGGYRAIGKYLTEVSRGFNVYPQNSLQYCHSGGPEKLEAFTIDSTYNSSVITDRTPTTLVDDPNNRWMFGNDFDSSTLANQIIAHVTPSGANITNTVGGQIFSGDQTGLTPLTEITIPAGSNATGGIVMLHPYLFYYGSVVGWSVPGDPTDLSGAGSGVARPWGQKIIKGLPFRGNPGASPAGIFWAYDAVILSSFVGGTTLFDFSTVATETSIMSADSVVDYDGVFFWAGVDRFLLFNGVVREVENQLNLNWFFDSVNPAQRSKVFAFKVPHFGEIWWCYPRGNATECTHAVVYNVREQTWYDTQLPTSGRASGQFSNGFAVPVLTDWTQTASGYKVWVHERGVDAIDGTSILPVQSYFETSDLSALLQGRDQGMRIERIEPDFVQSGDMSVRIAGRENARSPEVVSDPVTFPATATEPFQEVVVLKQQRRELRVRFESNAVGGDYQMGQVIGFLGEGDGTNLG